MVSLFVISTLEGWPDYLFQNIDGASETTGPILDNNTYVIYMFMSFIMVGSIFCVNLFVAIVSMNFHIAQEKQKNKFLNKEQEQWIQIQKLIYNSEIDPSEFDEPTGKYRKATFKFVTHSAFDVFIMLMIILNVVTMAMTQDDSTETMIWYLKVFNYIFTVIFIIEAVLKIFAMTFVNYINNHWNKSFFQLDSISSL